MFHGSHSVIVIAVVVAARFLLQRGLARRPRRRERRSRRAAEHDPRRRGPVRLVLHQARYDLLALMRNRQARYATVLLPLLLLVLMVSFAGDHRVGPQHAQASSYYVPGLAALAIIASSFVNLVISVVGQREAGVLKRRRATPVPAWALIAGRTLTATAVSAAVTTALVAAGRLAFGVQLAAAAIPGIAVTALAGAACFCALGYAVAGAIRSADAAQPVIQALMLPLYLGSGIFIPDANLPGWLRQTAALFPVERLADGLHEAFGATIATGDLVVLGAWAAAGVVVALRRFNWSPAAAV
jgi:ABC-2 type transport system permease protein